MGKSKARTSKKRNFNPTGIPTVKELEESEELTSTSFEAGSVEAIIEKLQSRGADDKECGAYTIANMASNSSFVNSLIENKVIRIAAPLLLDRNPAVRHAIAGCLRNVASCGDHNVVQAMVAQDIMTSVVALLQRDYTSGWSPSKTPESKIDSKAETFVEVCNLLWSLCESSNIALEIFNKRNVISNLLPCLTTDGYGLQIPLAVAQCLHTASEDNIEVSQILQQPLIQEQLRALMTLSSTEPEHILLRTIAAGIMLNVISGNIDNSTNDVTASIMDVIAFSLSEPITSTMELLSEQIASHKAERLNKYHEEQDLEEKVSAVKNTLKVLDHLLLAKQISLEILANICFGEDSEDQWEESDTSDETEMDIDDNSPATPFKLGLRVPCEVHGLIVNGKFLEKVIDQIVVPSDEILSVISENAQAKNIIKRLNTVRCRSLLCLNNMVQGLELEDLGGPSKLFDLWLNIANLVFKKTDMSNTDQLEAATSSMRAVLQKLAEKFAEGESSNHFSNMTEEDLNLLINICLQSQESVIKVNIIRCLGTIGCLMGNLKLDSSQRLISVIGSLLTEVCTKNTDLWVTAEALDVIFDVFAEDHLDVIAQEISLVEKLSNLLPSLKGRIKQQRKSLGEHLPVIVTAKSNLIRFVKYKNDQSKKN